MGNETCAAPLKVVAVRGLRLDGAGELLVGPSSRYTHEAPLLFSYTPTQEDRQRLSQNNGNGDNCFLYLGPPKPVDAADLAMDLCVLDAELIEFLAGGSIISDGYDTIGYLSPTEDTVNETGAALEVWSLAWAGKQRKLLGGSPAYYRHVFPMTTWQVGQISLKDDVPSIPMTGVAATNTGFGTGYSADPFPADVGASIYGWALVTDVPSGVCGYEAVA